MFVIISLGNIPIVIFEHKKLSTAHVDIRAVILFVILSLGDIPVVIFEHKKLSTVHVNKLILQL